MIRIILAFIVIATLFWLYKRWRALPKKQRRNTALQGLVYLGIALCLLAVVSGKLHWLSAVFAGVFVTLLSLAKFGFSFLWRALPFLNALSRSPFVQAPSFKTTFLEVHVDIKTGQVQGKVLSGRYAGEPISQLDKNQLDALEEDYRNQDKASYYLIRFVKLRAGGNYEHQTAMHASSQPSREEALQILGLAGQPSKKEIIAAHRSLMQKLHPDRGGNNYLASRVNLAKDVLIQQLDED